MYITNTTNEFTTGSSHVVFLNIFFYGDVTQKRHWQKNLPVGFNGLIKLLILSILVRVAFLSTRGGMLDRITFPLHFRFAFSITLL